MSEDGTLTLIMELARLAARMEDAGFDAERARVMKWLEEVSKMLDTVESVCHTRDAHS